MVVKPTVISLFAGTGGSSLGYQWAGFNELLAVDFDPHAVECFKLNFSDVPIWHTSVVDITGNKILEFCDLKIGALDVLDGSPPCQGFSMAGSRKVRDIRNNLFLDYWRLVNDLQPKVFVMENVTGMAKGKMKGRFIEIMKTLKNGNYYVKCKQMNSMYYGVPQSRERLIFIGVRKDLNKVAEFPIPSNRIITFKEALKNMISPGIIPKIYPMAKLYLPKLKQGESISKYHPTGAMFGTNRVKLNAPIGTLLKEASNQKYHPLEDRCLGLNELKILCSFPENWKLGSDYKSAVNRLGNAVMPKFMQAIAETIKEKVLQNKRPA